MVKLLLDENLSPWVAAELQRRGHDVVHLRDRGSLGILDHDVLSLAYREDRVLVTANVGDFRALAGARELHPGIVLLLDGGLIRSEQLELISRVIVAIRTAGDLVNRALTVKLDGGLVIEDLPADR